MKKSIFFWKHTYEKSISKKNSSKVNWFLISFFVNEEEEEEGENFKQL